LRIDRHRGKRIAFLLDNLSGGGAEQVTLNLASELYRRGYRIDLLVCDPTGALVDNVPDGIKVIVVGKVSSIGALLSALRADKVGMGLILQTVIRLGKLPGSLRYVAAIARYLAVSRPAAFVSALPKSNINAVLAKKQAGVDMRLMLGVHIHLSAQEAVARESRKLRMLYLSPLMRRYYRQADCIVAVSKGVAEDAVHYLGVDWERISTIHNPVAMENIADLAAVSPGHPWLSDSGAPVVLGMGRFVKQKNFPLLLRAFALVRKVRPLRLIILGGDASSVDQRLHRQELTHLACQLGVKDDIDMPGYTSNTYAFLSRAAMFVLSSRFEGFGNVLIEALLCGCPIVSTDCPSGPAEILGGGRFGRLVPIDDEESMARAIQLTLDGVADKSELRSRGQEFSVSRAVDQYEHLLFDG
jgi:glycosyltransferase involved in cell wall biosynthesis